MFTDKYTLHYSSEKLFATDGGYCTIPQLVTHREYMSERYPVLGDISTVEPLYLRFMEHSGTGSGKNTNSFNSHQQNFLI